MIPYSRQALSKKDIRSVLKVLESDWITQGPRIQEFEKKLTQKCGAQYAVAVANGTAALHLACLALGVQPGDEVITSPISFLATANCVLYSGGRPVFSDIEAAHWNLDSAKLRNKISKKTKGIIPVHFAGHPYDVEKIYQFAKANNLFVLEDACHALGAHYKVGLKWYPVGCCKHSDAAVLSFHPVKAIATGEGGAILTNRKDIYERLLVLRNHGMVRDPAKFVNKQPKSVSWYYEMQKLGFNYRLTDIQCALGITQLDRLDSFIKRRNEIAAIYDKAFKNLKGIQIPNHSKSAKSAYHLYVILLNPEKLTADRTEIFSKLREQGLGVQVHYIPIHLQPYYKRFGYQKGDFPRSENYYERCLSLPIFPSMTDSQIKTVIRIFRKTILSFTR